MLHDDRPPAALEAALVDVVGRAHVVTDPALRAGFERDWTGRFGGSSLAVIRPGTAAEVAAVLATASRARIPVVLQGGNTGLVGGGVPRGGELLVSLRRLDAVGTVDVDGRRVRAGGGATLAAVAGAAGTAGLDVGVDLASRDAATLGGMVATDAGGLHELANGSMGRQVETLELARVDGRVGPASPGELADVIGSEGTLAAITAVTLRLLPRLPAVATVLVGLDEVDAAAQLTARVRAADLGLVAAELLLRDGLDLVTRHLGLAAPFTPTPPVAVLLEARGVREPLDRLAEVVDSAAGVAGVVAAADAADRRRLWALREGHAEAISTLGVPHKLDVVVPDDRLAAFVAGVGDRIRDVDPAARVIVFGHLGVGDLHVNVIGPGPDDERVDDAVLGLVAELGGDVAGEHGAGIAKTAWLRRTRPAHELAAIAARKAAWDPAGLLNPGVIPAARAHARAVASPTIAR
jgi:FAD/FMN-containing dehydrogenase